MKGRQEPRDTGERGEYRPLLSEFFSAGPAGDEDEAPGCEKTRLRNNRRRAIEINPRSLRGDQRHFSVMRNPTIMMPRPITMFHHEIFGIG